MGKLINFHPRDIGLIRVGGMPICRRVLALELTLEHDLDLMHIAVPQPKFVIATDVVADQPDWPHFDVGSRFLEAFAVKGIDQALTWVLSSSR